MYTCKDAITYSLSLPGAYLDYPFGEEWEVLRHRGNGKIFCMCYVRNGAECLNLKCDRFEADFLRRAHAAVLPGYHMNKEHWNTVLLDGTLPIELLQEMILHSFTLTQPKPKAKTTKNSPAQEE